MEAVVLSTETIETVNTADESFHRKQNDVASNAKHSPGTPKS